MIVIAKHFHPMRGHVEHGATVSFSGGLALTIKSVTGGWGLFDQGGRQVGATAAGAYELTEAIVKLEDAKAATPLPTHPQQEKPNA